ncbi:uncharacterized protein LOC122497809 isoform X6 [Leptopilina heterotoma]|uniref:uncharacterized protein LOC122497809 isoform X6 n=1 Tax=Leptopilina heterotoma TaxID=63436 RepID=UPI001CA9A624|nr:uncharacterized protein LOC122497809 isoform X6 [Leptopilina heterotoma]
MFQDEGTTIKRELEDDESNGVLEENEVALKKQRTEEVLIKEEEVEIDEDNCIEKSNENNAEDNCEANKNTGNSSERNLQNQNPLEDSFWVQDGLFFEEQDPITLTTNNFPSIAEKPTTSTGASTCQRNDKISYQATRNQELTKGESKYDKELLTYLQNDTDGKGILTIYEKNNSLTPSARRTLVHLLVQREKDEALKCAKPGEVLKDWDVPSSRWIKVAQDVEDLFKSEIKEVFYSPFRKESKVKVLATGKLLDHFYYVKRVMREQGILAVNMKRRRKNENQQTGILDESQERDLEYLVNNTEPFDDVKEIFIKTRNLRRNITKWKNISISENLMSVKALRLDEPGQILIHLDFDDKYNDKKHKLFDKWPKIREHLMNVLRHETKGVTHNEFNYIALLKSMSSEQQDIIIFYLLHYITTNVQCKRKKKTKIYIDIETLRKLTSDEKRQSYLLHVQNKDELHSSVEKLKDYLQQKELPFEPIVAIVGPLLNIESFHVIVDDIVYTTKSFLEAVDLNFKVFYVFDRDYPPYVDDLWKFLQNVLYEIPLIGEKMSMQHKLLSGKIEMLCKT